MCGGSPEPYVPITKEELEKDTDNPYENPNSGDSKPDWKDEEDLKIPEKDKPQTSSDNYGG
tara:strand:- start:323 stop:505 length:183 start_codon:yes stop_codon:yes gene_type:complete